MSAATARRRLTAGLATALLVTCGSGIAVAERAATHHAPATAPFAGMGAVDFLPAAAPLQQVLSQPGGVTFRATLSPASQGGLFEVAPASAFRRPTLPAELIVDLFVVQIARVRCVREVSLTPARNGRA